LTFRMPYGALAYKEISEMCRNNSARDQVAVVYASAFRRRLKRVGRRHEVADGPAGQWFRLRKTALFHQDAQWVPWRVTASSGQSVPPVCNASAHGVVHDSTSHSTVRSLSKVSRLRPTVFLRATFTDLIIRSQYPPHQGAPSVMNVHQMRSVARCIWTAVQLGASKTLRKKRLAWGKVWKLSDCMIAGCPWRAMNLRSTIGAVAPNEQCAGEVNTDVHKWPHWLNPHFRQLGHPFLICRSRHAAVGGVSSEHSLGVDLRLSDPEALSISQFFRAGAHPGSPQTDRRPGIVDETLTPRSNPEVL
ncbi:hypothetical protein T01_7376, partial [Trichinella spiralis]